jgi:hypothetical protein
MKLVSAVVISFALVLWLSGQVLAGDTPFVVRSGHPKSIHSSRFSHSGSSVIDARRHGGHGVPGHPFPHRRHHFGHHGHLPHHIFIPHHHFIFPHSHHTVVINSPFFCLAHEVGFVSRIGLIDHVSGTHKVPLKYAASICPEEWGGCLFDGY